MSSMLQVIIFSLVGGVVSLIGGFLLLANKKSARNLAEYATPFAAGALLAAAFIDLLQEAAHIGDVEQALTFALVGILAFFLLERFLHWFHHHHEHENKKTDPKIPLIIVGDTLHNFIDGIAIAAGFLVSPSVGIVVTIAVAAHEIPQEIGDFGLLLKKGMRRKMVIIVNILSALATTVAAVLFFQIGQDVAIPLDIVLGLVAGFFIYIAVSDIIPSIHKNEEKVIAGPQTALLILGVIIVGVLTTTLHGYIDQDDNHSHGAETSHEEAHDEHTEDEHAHDDTFEVSDHDDVPTVDIELKEDVKSGWNIHIETTNFTFTPEAVNSKNTIGEGHAHIYVNDKKLARVYGEHFHIESLIEGDEVRVTLNANDHAEYAHDGEIVQATIIVGEGEVSHDDEHSH